MINSKNTPYSPVWISIGLGVAVLALSAASILIRSCQAPSLVIAAYRLTTAFVVLTPLSLFKNKSNSVTCFSRKTISLLGFSALCLSLHFVLWITSVESTSITKSTVLVTTSPIFVILINWVLFKKQPNRSIITGICLATTGTMVLVYDQSIFEGGSRGDILAIIAAVCMAGYLTAGYEALKTIPAHLYILTVYGMSSAILIALALSLQLPLTGFDTQTYVLLVLIGLIPQLIGHSLLNTALQHLQPGIVAIAILGEPVGASIFAWIFFNETPTYIALLGGVLILCSIVFVTRFANHNRS